MESPGRIVISVPSEVAEALEAIGSAVPLPRARTEWADVAELAVMGFQVTSVMVSLAQIPMVIEDLGKRIRDWSQSRRGDQPAYLVVKAQGKAGKIHVQLNDTTNAHEIMNAVLHLLDSETESLQEDENSQR